MAFVLTIELYHSHKMVSNCWGFYVYAVFPHGVWSFNDHSKWRNEWCGTVYGYHGLVRKCSISYSETQPVYDVLNIRIITTQAV